MKCNCGAVMQDMGKSQMGDGIYYCPACGIMLETDDQERTWNSIGTTSNERKVGGRWIPDK